MLRHSCCNFVAELVCCGCTNATPRMDDCIPINLLGSTIAAVVWCYAGVASIPLWHKWSYSHACHYRRHYRRRITNIAGKPRGEFYVYYFRDIANISEFDTEAPVKDQRIYLVLSMAIFSYMIFKRPNSRKKVLYNCLTRCACGISIRFFVSRLTDTNSHLLNEISEHIKTQ